MQFVREIHIMSNLRHPHVLEYIGAVLSAPHICLVTECASRGSLKSILRSSRSLSWRTEKRRYLIQICSGMNYLHTRENSVLHRDLKADNCLVTKDYLVKVSDFGLSRVVPREKAKVRSGEERSDELGRRVKDTNVQV